VERNVVRSRLSVSVFLSLPLHLRLWLFSVLYNNICIALPKGKKLELTAAGKAKQTSKTSNVVSSLLYGVGAPHLLTPLLSTSQEKTLDDQGKRRKEKYILISLSYCIVLCEDKEIGGRTVRRR
jgi:hypothetical protein